MYSMTHTTRAPKINADMSPMLCYVMDWLMADTFDAVSYMTNFVGQGFFFLFDNNRPRLLPAYKLQ
jgi:hypothetical protein